MEREKRWIERRSYFIRKKAILLRICEVIDYFIVPLHLWCDPRVGWGGGGEGELATMLILGIQYLFVLFIFLSLCLSANVLTYLTYFLLSLWRIGPRTSPLNSVLSFASLLASVHDLRHSSFSSLYRPSPSPILVILSCVFLQVSTLMRFWLACSFPYAERVLSIATFSFW